MDFIKITKKFCSCDINNILLKKCYFQICYCEIVLEKQIILFIPEMKYGKIIVFKLGFCFNILPFFPIFLLIFEKNETIKYNKNIFNYKI